MSDSPEQQPDPPEKSLGDQATGTDVSRPELERSLGEQSTTGDALSSLSDLSDNLGEAIDSGLPIIDLAARYEIEGELGQGGMGAVLLATDRQLKRKVAIKRILGPLAQNKNALQRFVTEAQSIAKLNHFNIVQVYEFGRDAEGPFLVLEYVDGGSLLEKLKGGKLKIKEAIEITCQLCDGLAVAHEQGIIHRDIKPANILLTRRGVPKLTDFGLARQDDANHGQTQVGVVLGTIDYMSPEQRRDATATDARSDLWSLAATCYQLITGEVPRVIELDAIPQKFRKTFSKALKRNPDERFSTVQQLKNALRKKMATVGTVAATVPANPAAGVCPSCNEANDLGRRFCRGCRASLIEPCLSCQADNPVWEDICGECGSSQREERERIAAAAEKAAAEKAATEKAAAEKAATEKAAVETVVTLKGHSNSVQSASFSPDGKRIVSGSHDNRVKVWDTETGQELLTLKGHAGNVHSASFSPDGKRIASGSFDQTLKVWDAETGQETLTLKGHTWTVLSVAFSPDGKRIVSGSLDRTLRVWNSETGQQMRILKGHAGLVNSAAFSPDGKRIASGSFDNTVKVWDVDSGQELLALNGHSSPVLGVAFSPDGKRIVSSSSDQTLKVWNADTGWQILTLTGHTNWVYNGVFSPDGKRIVSGSSDQTLRVWNSETGQETLTLRGHSDSVISVAFSPDGKRIVSGSLDQTLKVWDAKLPD